jgi:hypothetical protein
VAEEYHEFDTTSQILQEICSLRNHTIHRTIRQKPVDVFYLRALNRQIIVKKNYPQHKQDDLALVKPLRELGEISAKIFKFDYDIYIILVKEGDKYKIKSLYNFVHDKNIVKRRWYKPYELRIISPQQALEYLKSSLVWQYFYHRYNEDIHGLEKVKKYLQSLL